MATAKLNSKNIVVCGGGLMGLSTVYHLAKRGASVMLFERDYIGAHNESKAPNMGLVTAPYFFVDAIAQRTARRSLKLYSALAQAAGFKYQQCGRVYLATSDESVYNAQRIYSRSLIHTNKTELLDCPSEMLAKWPMLATEDVRLALYSHDDVILDYKELCNTLCQAAKEYGAKIYENCDVRKVMVGEGRRVYAVDTDEGVIDTNVFVNAAGSLSNMVPVTSLSERFVRIPAHPCTYTLLMAESLQYSGVSETSPTFVDMDHSVFIHANNEKTVCGGFIEDEIRALQLPQGIQSEWTIPQADWDRFYPNLKSLVDRCPALGLLKTGDLFTSMEMYTPDNYPLIGETEQVNGYFIANGLNGQGLAMAGGLGEVLAQWISDGASSLTKLDISKFDITRFTTQHTNPQYLYERVPEIASHTFKPLHHSHQCHTARNLRMSPIYHQLRNAGALFAEILGYERPLWFNPEAAKESNRNAIYSGQNSAYGYPVWHKFVAKEYESCRERVGIIDMSSFSKFDITGPDTVQFLQKICSADVDRPVGTTVYTGMQNEYGGYTTDCTLSRISNDQYFLVAPSVQQVRCLLWLKRWINEFKMNVHVNDVTGLYTALDVVGPSSRNLMKDVTGRDMGTTEFPSFACKEIHVGIASGIRAISVTHCGELGFVLYFPNEIANYVYERIIEAGQEYGLMHAGYNALRHLRIEKFYVYWGQDINSTVTPIQCGRLFRVDFNKDFIGKEALLEQNKMPLTKRFVQLLVDQFDLETDPWPQGDEPIYKNGVVCGWTTSAAYGFTLGTQVCIGYLRNEEGDGVTQDFVNSGIFEIDIAGKRFPVRINLHSPSLPMISSEHPTHFMPTR